MRLAADVRIRWAFVRVDPDATWVHVVESSTAPAVAPNRLQGR